MWIKMQQLEPYVEQLTGLKLKKEYNKAVYCHPVYLTYMQSIPCEMPGCMSYKLELRLLGEISTTSDIYHSNGRKLRGTQEPLDEGEGRE